ncbi:probable Acetolactate synthase small subunit, mitochondrial [Hanseniaspora guilliermondii]|uniref:Probable Acetolactate synthase small subunit, mitochondrial n=1 Tax=Hanseniaspora guilliermondii TaxID=56406 RepID=A0A1L0FER2_9ASCO|nr:probable Acetolactate synthase small subunit, mitochondrial [Hanseniaspora guilliermondii]
MLRASTIIKRSKFTNTSTSAIIYKQFHKNKKLPPLPTLEDPQWSANTAVSSILYESPPVKPIDQNKKSHILNCLVTNEPGVLSRISGTLAARGFNIDSLVVCNTEVKELSRMTIVLKGLDGVVEQARRQIEDLVPVYAVLDYTQSDNIQREMLLARVSLLGSEYFEDLLQHHSKGAGADISEKELAKAQNQKYHPKNLPFSELTRLKNQHLANIKMLTENFGGKVVDISQNNCIVEVSAKPKRITNFLQLLKPYGLLEVSRSGVMALPRTPLKTSEDEDDEDINKKINDIVDVSQLPPG